MPRMPGDPRETGPVLARDAVDEIAGRRVASHPMGELLGQSAPETAANGGGTDPSERGRSPSPVVEALAAEGVDAVLVTFVDNAGVVRARAVPLVHFAGAASSGLGLSTAWHVVSATDRVTSSPYVGNPAGDLRLVADAQALRPLPGLAKWAWSPADQYDADGSPHACCPRSYLRRAIERCRKLGLELIVGYELEFWLAREDASGTPSSAHRGPAVGALAIVEVADYAHDLIAELSREDIGLETLNAEYSDGQLEVSLSAKDPLRAVDANVLARLAIHAIARRHGLRASFAPAFAGPMGNGGHIHMSVWRDGQNRCAGGQGPAGMEDDADAFLAGMLAELPAVTAIGAPTMASYLRLQPSRWAGAYACWGIENREAGLRFVPARPGGEDAANVEVKSFDEAANPYLLLGALLHAGAAGVESGAHLPPPFPGDPATSDEAALAAAGVSRLPATLEQAIAAMAESALLAETMGPALFDSYLAVRRAEVSAFGGASDEEIIDAYRWRF